MKYLVQGFKDSFKMRGVASRKEYWLFTLQYLLASLVLFVASAIIIVLLLGESREADSAIALVITVITLAGYIPSFSILARRIHDTGRSAWHILWAFIPIIGLWVLYLACSKSKITDNKFR